MRWILFGIIVSAFGGAGFAARAQAPNLPSDVSALVAHRAVCAKILARGWGDEQPWADHGCYDIDQPVGALRHKYANSTNILAVINEPWTRREDFIMRPAELAMRAPHAPGSLWPLAALDWHDGHAEDAPAAVAVLNNEIVMTAPPDISATLTHDGVRKTSPVFSRDGQKIAFLETTDPEQGVGRIVTIDRAGHELNRIDVRPPNMRIPQPLMPPRIPENVVMWQRIARYQWISRDRIAVQSSAETYGPTAFLILDSGTGKVLTSFIDTSGKVRFSADGAHYVYREDIPLGYTCKCRPYPKADSLTIRTDAGVVTLPNDRLINLDVGAVWSEDGDRLFIPFHSAPPYSEGRLTNYLYVWSDGSGKWLGTGFGGQIGEFYAKNGDVLVTTATGQGSTFAEHGWKFPAGRQGAVPFEIGRGDFDPAARGKKHRSWLVGTLTTINPQARTPDFWCKDCDLAILPRESELPDQ